VARTLPRQQRGSWIACDYVRSSGAEPRSLALGYSGQAFRLGDEAMAIAERAAGTARGCCTASLPVRQANGFLERPRRRQSAAGREGGYRCRGLPTRALELPQAQDARSRIASRHRPRSALNRRGRRPPVRGRRRFTRAEGATGSGGAPDPTATVQDPPGLDGNLKDGPRPSWKMRRRSPSPPPCATT
jgi:hypothetical protein